ncbi:MAG: hypothetical protein P8M80_16625 [Pirellulaceae bacterium]|nr:hypothetical protein [Pirellulaceae bacterium]
MKRRDFLWATAAISLGNSCLPAAISSKSFPPVRTITSGPKHHWFGYYDKLQFDPTNRFVLSNQVDFEHRTPTAEDTIKVGMVDTQNQDQWIELGQSQAWGWQQGCMLQWLPGSKQKVIFNDRQKGRFVSHVVDVRSRNQKTLESPVYTLAANGAFGLAADFARIQIMRPGYGYVGLDDENHESMAPKDSGVFKVDMVSGKSRLILSLADVARIPHHGSVLTGVKHYFNHLLISPDSNRFIALHRWRKQDDSNPSKAVGGFTTRMITANVDGSDVYVLDPSGYTSHFIWRDPEHVCMWTRPVGKKAGFYLMKDKTPTIEPVGADVMTLNGHNTYLPIPKSPWILNDTYPDKNRNQKPYLYHVPTKTRVWLGEFHLPVDYRGEWRCDTHPRSSHDGRIVCIDSPHTGAGRQLHLIDVSGVIDSIGSNR